MSRDWSADLWPTSFAGVPFWTRKAETEFGRRLQKDQFPELDAPFIQDLGGDFDTDQVEAYLVGDTSDADALAFVAGLKRAGAAALVLPAEGPVQGWFEKGRRAYELDRQGYIGFALTFVRAGVAVANPSVDYLAQMVSDAVDGLGDAMAALAGQIVLS